MRYKAVIFFALCGMFIFAGCSERHPAPPTASAHLMLRFFSSMRKKDHASAVLQGVKLYAVDKNHDPVIQLVMLEQSNQYVKSAQSALNKGNLAEAISILEQGMKTYPDNKAIPAYFRRVRQLRNVNALISAMEKANNSASMSAALTAARVGLAANTTPALASYFSEYEKRISEVSSKEKQTGKTPSIVEPASFPGGV